MNNISCNLQNDIICLILQFLFKSIYINKLERVGNPELGNPVTSSGAKPYLDHGLYPININSSKSDLINAYPKKALQLMGLPNNFILKDDPLLIYKK